MRNIDEMPEMSTIEVRSPPSARAESANSRPFYVKKVDLSHPPQGRILTHNEGGFGLITALFL